ncbi:MAG: queuosine precursor transporter [Lentisphaeria bacterium]|nr:queuosine precursor transporter [Victivallales bacterium]MCR4573429.1 queuosine precursor transporter [Lentisphaeria bacterium]
MRKTNENLILLNTLFTTALIISNVVTAKLFHTGITLFGTELVLPGAAVCYACTFLFTDVIGEIWGRAEASKSIIYGFASQLFASMLILFTENLPAQDPAMQEAYSKLLGQNLLFVIASLIAYFASQLWDVWFFHKIRDWYLQTHRGTTAARWLWNNASTTTSQIIDTILFIGIVFGIGFHWLWTPQMWPALAATIVGQYVFKFLLAILDTPFFYLLTRSHEKTSSTMV